MDETIFNKAKTTFERNGGKMESSPELDKYLDFRGADATTLNKDFIIFRYGAPPTASEFYEELIHTAQFKQGKISAGLNETIEIEIEAKEKLIKYQRQYRIPDSENEDTIKQINILKQSKK